MKMINDRVNIFNEAVRSTVMYLTKKKLDGFYFSVISWILTNLTYYSSIFIALVYVHHTYLFLTQLSFQNPLYATKTCFAYFASVQLCISSFACKLPYRHTTLVAKKKKILA